MASSIKVNPDTSLFVNVYSYNSSTFSYSPAGKSGPLRASQYLHINVSDVVSGLPEDIKFDHKSAAGLEDYRPYHTDIDLHVESKSTYPLSHSDNNSDCSDSDSVCSICDPFIVEKIVAKRYNSHKCQYEYQVKWLGYDSKENTRELPSNIPDKMLNDYEQSILSTAKSEPKRSGLRPRSSLKSRVKEDLIVNI